MLLYDLLLYRQKNAQLAIGDRYYFVNCAFDMMPSAKYSVYQHLPLFVLVEQTILRQFMVAAPYDALTVAAMLAYRARAASGVAGDSGWLNIFAPSAAFYAHERALCPEASKILIIYYMMAYKLTGLCAFRVVRF